MCLSKIVAFTLKKSFVLSISIDFFLTTRHFSCMVLLPLRIFYDLLIKIWLISLSFVWRGPSHMTWIILPRWNLIASIENWSDKCCRIVSVETFNIIFLTLILWIWRECHHTEVTIGLYLTFWKGRNLRLLVHVLSFKWIKFISFFIKLYIKIASWDI